jgi:transposase
VQHYLAFYDVHEDQLFGYFYRRKRHQECLRALKRMRKRYPKKDRIYLVLDNFAPHQRHEVREWAKANNVIFVWTPTNASWLNKIECQFTELKEFALSNSDYRSHPEVRRAITRFVGYRNRRQRKQRRDKLKRH